MDLIDKIEKLILDTTVVADVAQNKTKGNVDVIGAAPVKRHGIGTIGYECPKGQMWDKETRTCIPEKNESIVVGAPYASGNSTISGSGQTRVWGGRWNLLDALETKEPVKMKMADKTKENLGRPDLKFDSILGAYAPKKIEIDTTQMENEDE